MTSSDFHGMQLTRVAPQKATIGPGEEHSFSTNFWSDTSVSIHNSNVIGHLQVWALGKMQGERDVPAGYDQTASKSTHGVDVTCRNTGKSTFKITVK